MKQHSNQSRMNRSCCESAKGGTRTPYPLKTVQTNSIFILKKINSFIERLWCRVEYKEINLNGQNVFNLTMVDRVALLVSFPLEMTRFIEPAPFQYEPAMN